MAGVRGHPPRPYAGLFGTIGWSLTKLDPNGRSLLQSGITRAG